MLYEGPKYISHLIRTVPTPEGFVAAWQAVVDDPGVENARVLMGMVDSWLEQDLSTDEALSAFIRDNELAWLRGTIPTEFW